MPGVNRLIAFSLILWHTYLVNSTGWIL